MCFPGTGGNFTTTSGAILHSDHSSASRATIITVLIMHHPLLPVCNDKSGGKSPVWASCCHGDGRENNAGRALVCGAKLSLVLPRQHAKANANMLKRMLTHVILKMLMLTEFLPETANLWFLMSIAAEMKQDVNELPLIRQQMLSDSPRLTDLSG